MYSVTSKGWVNNEEIKLSVTYKNLLIKLKFFILISMQPYGVNFLYFKIWINGIHSLKYQRFATLGCKDRQIRTYEFLEKHSVRFK